MALDLSGFYSGLEERDENLRQIGSNIGYLAAEGVERAGERRTEALLKGERDTGLLGMSIGPKLFGRKARKIESPISKQEVGQMTIKGYGAELFPTAMLAGAYPNFEKKLQEKLGYKKDKSGKYMKDEKEWDATAHTIADLPLVDQDIMMRKLLTQKYGAGTVTSPATVQGEWKQDPHTGDWYKDIEGKGLMKWAQGIGK